MRIQEGDRVRIKVDESMSGNASILNNALNKHEYIHAEVKTVYEDSISITNIEEWDFDKDQVGVWRGAVSIVPPKCYDCSSEKIYYDSREKWVCPFCEL